MAEEGQVNEDVTIHKSVLYKLNQSRQQRKMRTFELARTTEGFFEMRCFDLSKKKSRGSTAGGEQHPTAVWQLNWTSTEALAIIPHTGASGKPRKGSSRSSTAQTKRDEASSWSFSVAGLLNNKNLKQEQLVLESSTQAGAAQWVEAIKQAMQELMARALLREDICGFKVLRIQEDRSGMVVSTYMPDIHEM
jgi:hypothetical protein